MSEYRLTFQLGQRIRCISKPTLLKFLNLKKGDEFIVTAVDPGTYSDLLNVRRLDSEFALLNTPLLSSNHFEEA